MVSKLELNFQSVKLINILLLGILLLAAIHDAKHREIPNALTFPLIILGLAFHSWLNGYNGFLFSLGGIFWGMGFLIFFYLARAMGAGDVKLMGAVGSILGPAGVFNAFLFTAIVGGIYAIIILLIRGGFIESMSRLCDALRLTILTRRPVTPNEKKAGPVLCYGIAIAIGTSLSIVF